MKLRIPPELSPHCDSLLPATLHRRFSLGFDYAQSCCVLHFWPVSLQIYSKMCVSLEKPRDLL